jgi:hypothetical protein
VPADDDAVVMTVAPDALAPPLAGALLGADALAGVLLDAAGVLLLPALEHAAVNSATPTAPPTPVASLAGADMRFMGFLIVFVSCPSAAWPRQFLLPQMTVDTDTGRDVNEDWMPSGKRRVIRTTQPR